MSVRTLKADSVFITIDGEPFAVVNDLKIDQPRFVRSHEERRVRREGKWFASRRSVYRAEASVHMSKLQFGRFMAIINGIDVHEDALATWQRDEIFGDGLPD